MLTRPPFALFALEHLSTETLNSLLQKAHDGSTVDAWWWYLAETTDYRAAPQRKPDGTGQEATQTPIDPSFSSAFAGKRLEDVAHWLMSKPKSVDVDDRFFGVLDKKAGEGKIAICRLNDPKVEKEVAWCILNPADYSTLYLGGLDSDLDWIENVRAGKYTLDL
ncbi:MAG: hypothetical protein LQ338_007086 [Usnochroma carphineum]|nr:MAG: hypothetical protein LQ338_007086 [Usnochroma carphineum]